MIQAERKLGTVIAYESTAVLAVDRGVDVFGEFGEPAVDRDVQTC